MKKFLLSILAVCGAFLSASADKVVYEIDYSATPWNFYVMGYAPEVVDGVLTSEQPLNDEGQPAWYQYFIADQIPTQEGKSYVATVKIKTSTDASMALNMGWGWGEGEILNSTINTTSEWAEISHTFENIGGTSSNLVLQPGMYDGTVEIAWVKVAELGETTGVEVVAPAVESSRIVVYSLLGVKVLDTDDASQLNTLKKGIYIVNGKKVAL